MVPFRRGIVYDVLHARPIPTGNSDSQVTRFVGVVIDSSWRYLPLNPPMGWFFGFGFNPGMRPDPPCVLSRRSNPTDGDKDNNH